MFLMSIFMFPGAKVAIFCEITKGFSLFYLPYPLFSAKFFDLYG